MTACVWGAGGKILLNKATLRLKKGRRYGLCGANGVGKVPSDLGSFTFLRTFDVPLSQPCF